MWPSIEWPGKDTWNAFSNRLIFVLLAFRPALENPLPDHFELRSQITLLNRLFSIHVKTIVCFFYLVLPSISHQSMWLPHSFAPLSPLFSSLSSTISLLLLFITFLPPVIPPPSPPACQLLRLALIVSQFQCQEGRIYRNQRWQGIAALSNGPIHRGPSVAMPESIRLPFITEHCLCRDLETSFLSVSSVISTVFSKPLTNYHWV